jgi:hypothetical protein
VFLLKAKNLLTTSSIPTYLKDYDGLYKLQHAACSPAVNLSNIYGNDRRSFVYVALPYHRDVASLVRMQEYYLYANGRFWLSMQAHPLASFEVAKEAVREGQDLQSGWRFECFTKCPEGLKPSPCSWRSRLPWRPFGTAIEFYLSIFLNGYFEILHTIKLSAIA